MNSLLCTVFLLLTASQIPAQTTPAPPTFTTQTADRFANLALACVHKEYPNKLSHTLNSDADVAPPRQLTPAFYGCYDWHSSVHGHWLLVRLLKTFPTAAFAPQARESLRQSLTADNLAKEATYLREPGRASFERPYGLAWLLQLAAELREWNDPEAQTFAANLRPLEDAALARLNDWLPKLSYPVRIGEHAQTAFALGLMLDYAQATRNTAFTDLLASKVRQFYLNDKQCPLTYEPSGEDFLSPCLGEADAVRRVLPTAEFAAWLENFLPQISDSAKARSTGNAHSDANTGSIDNTGTSNKKSGDWLRPVVSPDPSDPKLAHLDGLNLSRAWMLEGIASSLPENDDRLPAITQSAQAHRTAGLAAVTGEHYEGGHWLASFAVYLLTHRGLGTHVYTTYGISNPSPTP